MTTPSGQNDKLSAALSYLWILSIIILLIKRDSPFVQFHARQGVVLWIISIIFFLIPGIGWFLNGLLFIVIAIGFFQALNGMEWRIPGVAKLAEKIKI